ncbi:OmpA family protein [Steroidobacter sp.]|uniref:OmpA family protein n=1 Tax=Steroidobacter sp. TaxID=1978227 RepID=UPI001A58F3BF|nr:OmpA family protein [Steroidobacter sp.]MBL8268436.1 OmpA family protein [Steroidobacter sp.]
MVHRFSKLAGVGIVVSCLLAGCSTVNPYTRESQTSKAAKGAGIGAAAGAVVGLLTKGDKLQNALIGAGVGALAGGGVGYYMDVQEAKLRQKLEGTGVSVTRVGDNITLNMPSSITFATNSADLNAGFYNALGGVAMVLKEYNKTVIEVAGHTDSTGSDQYNQQLSQRRAASVATYLTGQGISGQRLLTVGAGEAHPVASNDSEAGRAQNRRVEMTIVPITKG